MSVRVRFAPSPTGALHIGGVRTALYNYLFAKKMGGTFILRIEDTDQTRYVEGAEEYIIESLKWCGLEPQEGVGFGGEYGSYRQSERKEIYRKYAQILLDNGWAYYAFDTPEELAQLRADAEAKKETFKYGAANRMQLKNSLALPANEVQQLLENGTPYILRLKVPANEIVNFNDIVRGAVSYSTNEMDDKVMLKTDGLPTYHLANVVDDRLMKITHVIRGEEWLPSTPLHVLLYRAFGWAEEMPNFVHLPLILKPTGKGKLSKRDGDKLGIPVFPLDWTDPKSNELVKGFREFGFLPEAMVNFLAFLGWNPGTEQELFNIDELAAAFDMNRIVKSGARYDFDKAKWFNQQYIIKTENATLATKVRPILEANGVKDIDDAFLNNYIDLYKERVVLMDDFWTQGYYFFQDLTDFDAKTIRKKWKTERRPLFNQLNDDLNKLDDFSAVNVEASVKAFMNENELGFGAVLPILRVGLAGTMKGPSVFDMMALMDKDFVVSRLTKAYDIFDASKVSA